MNRLWLIGLCSLLSACPKLYAERTANPSKITTQTKRPKTYLPFSFAVRGGVTHFWGELHHQNRSRIRGLGVYYHLTDAEAFSFGAELHWGRLTGEKRNFFNSRFVNEFQTIELVPRWDMIRGITWNQHHRFSLHWYAGVGLIFFHAEAYDLTSQERVRYTNDPVRSRRTALFKKYGPPFRKTGVLRTHEAIIPFGFTPACRITPNLEASLDFRFIWARTDKLDATSGYRLINPSGKNSYSNTPNDIYSCIQLTLRYRLMKKT